MGKALRVLRKTAKWGFVVFCVFVLSLFFRQQPLPQRLVRSLCEWAVAEPWVCCCETASIGFRHGLELKGVKLFDLSRRDSMTAAFSAESVSIKFLLHQVRIVKASLPRLGDSYYDHAAAAAGTKRELDLSELPLLPDFDLELVEPSILGIDAKLVTATVVSEPSRLVLSGIRLVWPDADYRMALSGQCSLDLPARRITGSVRGLARQVNIRPLLVSLNLGVALPYFDAFTEVPGPVDAGCRWDVHLQEGPKLALEVEIHTPMGRYNGVEFRRTDGVVRVDVQMTEAGKRYTVRVRPLEAPGRPDGNLAGWVEVQGTNEFDRVALEATSSLSLAAAQAVAGFPGAIDPELLVCETKPQLTAAGHIATDAADPLGTSLNGTFACGRARLNGVPVHDLTFGYAFSDGVLALADLHLTGKAGGRVNGTYSYSHGKDGPDNFALNLNYENGSFEELADGFNFDFGERRGLVSAALQLYGPLDKESVAPDANPRAWRRHLNGGGSFRCSNGHIAQMRLFLALTQLLADTVPGVSAIVNQSHGRADFTIRDGVAHTDNLLIEGALFSIAAVGDYDLVDAKLDFRVTVRFLRDESFLGKYFVRPITWTFSQLLMEFHLTGTTDEPKWEYLTPLDSLF